MSFLCPSAVPLSLFRSFWVASTKKQITYSKQLLDFSKSLFFIFRMQKQFPELRFEKHVIPNPELLVHFEAISLSEYHAYIISYISYRSISEAGRSQLAKVCQSVFVSWMILHLKIAKDPSLRSTFKGSSDGEVDPKHPPETPNQCPLEVSDFEKI